VSSNKVDRKRIDASKSTILTSRAAVGRSHSERTWYAGRLPRRASSHPRGVERWPSVHSDLRHRAQRRTSVSLFRPLTKSQLCDITMTSRSVYPNVACSARLSSARSAGGEKTRHDSRMSPCSRSSPSAREYQGYCCSAAIIDNVRSGRPRILFRKWLVAACELQCDRNRSFRPLWFSFDREVPIQYLLQFLRRGLVEACEENLPLSRQVRFILGRVDARIVDPVRHRESGRTPKIAPDCCRPRG